MRDHAGFCVWDSLADAFIHPRAAGVRHSSTTRLFGHGARCVWHLLCACLLDIGACCVWHPSCAVDGHLSTDRIRNLLFTDLRHHSCAADFLFDHAGHPSLAADLLRWTRAADDFRAARVTWIWNAFLNHWSRNTLRVGLPASTANIDSLLFCNWLECCVAAFLVARLRFSLVAGVANVAIARLIDWFANVVAACAIAGLVDWLAHCVADISIAGLVDRFSNVALHGPITCFSDRSADASGYVAITRFIDGLTDGVTLVSVARLVHVAHALDRNSFRAVIVDNTRRFDCLRFPDNFTNRSVVYTAANFCL